MPLVEDVATSISSFVIGAAEGPQVAWFGFPCSGFEVFDGGFVCLEVGFSEHFCVHGLVDAAEVVVAEIAHPLAHGVAGKVDAVAHEEVLFLAVVGLVIAVAVGGDLGGKAWGE